MSHATALATLLAGVCLGLAAPAASAQPAASRSVVAAAPLAKVPRVDFRARTLGNGLQVVTSQMRSSPTVSVQVWYHVGARDDPAGRSGFAHLFEHLMFKSTENLKPEQFDRLTEDVGGFNNAFTSNNVTGYHEVVPSNHLETMIWAEAERMANLRVDESNFRSERGVVQEEFRQRVLASPYGRFGEALSTRPYLQHPYQRSPIGSIADLDAATLADVEAFHRAWYRPDNATLVVAGDFDPAQLDAWIDRYFGRVPRPATPLPRLPGDEPAWTADRSIAVTGPNVPLPAVGIAWLAPPVTSPDTPALKIAAALLSGGESSRLNQSLVYRQQVAAQAGFDADLRAGPGLLYASAVVAGGKSIDEARQALLDELKRLADRGPGAAELLKVKTQLVTEAFTSRQTPNGLASALAEAAVLEGGPDKVNQNLAALQRVTGADVQRVLRRYVIGARKVVVDYGPEASRP